MRELQGWPSMLNWRAWDIMWYVCHLPRKIVSWLPNFEDRSCFFRMLYFQLLPSECFNSEGNLDLIRSLWSAFVRWLGLLYLSSSLSFFPQKYLLKAFPTFDMEYVLFFFYIPLPSLEWTYSSINHDCLGYAFPWKVSVHLNNSSFAPRDHYDAYVPLQNLSLPNYVRSIIVITTSTPSAYYGLTTSARIFLGLAEAGLFPGVRGLYFDYRFWTRLLLDHVLSITLVQTTRRRQKNCNIFFCGHCCWCVIWTPAAVHFIIFQLTCPATTGAFGGLLASVNGTFSNLPCLLEASLGSDMALKRWRVSEAFTGGSG